MSPEVLAIWKTWVRDTYIPHVMQSGFFENYKVLKLITTIEDFDNTYAIQFVTSKVSQMEELAQLFELDFEFMIATKFGEKVLFFRSLLQDIDL